MPAFSAAELATLLPGFTASEEEKPFGLDVFGDGVGGDPDVGDAPPDLSSFPALRRAVAADRTIARLAAFLGRGLGALYFAAYIACTAALLAPPFVFADGRYSQRALGVGTAAAVFAPAWVLLWYTLFALQAAPSTATLNRTVLATVSGWHELCSSPEPSELVAHRQDPLLPCPCQDCAAWLPRLAGNVRLPHIFLHTLNAVFASWVAPLWTPLVVLAPDLWTSPFVAAVAVGLPCALLTNLVLMTAIVPGHAALIALSTRLQVRAVDLVLRSCMADAYARFEHPAVADAPPAVDILPLSTLHSRLSARWRRASAELTASRRTFAALFPGWIVAAVISAAGAGCIPAWPLLILINASIVFWTDLILVAASNEGPTRAAGLYRSAGRTAAELAQRCGASDPALASCLRGFRDVLSSYAGEDDVRARLFGFPVDWTLLRSLAATVLTLVFGAWTLLRSAGVWFTMETYCPS